MTQTTSERQKEIREINYISKDFDGFKADLIDFVKKYFPDEWQDFNEASGGMALLEMVAYLGDSLAFLMDRQVNEGFIDRAVEPKNVFSLAQNMGYKPKFATPAITNISVDASFVDATSGSALFALKKGSRVTTNIEPAISFELLQDVDFGLSANRKHTKGVGATQATYSISGVSAAAGFSKLFSYTVSNTPTAFLKLELPDTEITEITSVSSDDGYEWFQVDHLAQNTIFTGDVNTTSTSGDIPHILKLKRVPRRFVIEKSARGKTAIVFGSGISSAEDSEIIPNPEDFVLPPSLRGSASGFTPMSIDSSNFLKTRSLGIAPRGVKVDINYRVGGGIETNVGRETITRLTNRIIAFKNPTIETTNPTLVDTVLSTLTLTNPQQATGGGERETTTAIKQNALSYFNAQNRAVTLQDYQVRVLSMPATFGSVFRSYARKDPNNSLGVELLLAAKNSQNEVIAASETLKNNIESYIKQFKSFSDSVKLTDAKIINIGVDFSIVAVPNINPNEALLESFLLLKDILRSDVTNFNDTLVIADFTSRIQASTKIRSVAGFKFTNKANSFEGRQYSTTTFDIGANTVNGILSFPEDAVWEVKFPNLDIIGRTV
tara:strand:- start:2966 stop:4786 length:1821 start_codon:yes stop_codon:yes gene_type:complete